MAEAPKATEHKWVGRYVLVRCTGAGVHAGILVSLEDGICELTRSRRLWGWKVDSDHTFLSGVARYGIDHKQSSVGTEIDVILTEPCEIILCSAVAEQSTSSAPECTAK